MKVSVVATVKNEQNSIEGLLTSLVGQSRRPDEIVIVDGGSTDSTLRLVRSFDFDDIPFKLLIEPGSNISQGRNRAITAASHEIIAATDAGVVLSPTWLENLIRPFEGPGGDGVDVVSGFFEPLVRTTFEKAMGAAVLPSVEEIEPAKFLPSSRSVAFRKSAWRQTGGYPEWLDYCEDLIFDLELRRNGCRFTFAPSAIVYFRPRSSLRAFFRQYFLYARGDGKADLWVWRHAIRYAAYSLAILALILGFGHKIFWLAIILGAAIYLYRPYRRLWPLLEGEDLLGKLKVIAWVPLIRLTGDMAKISGYPVGVLWRILRRRELGNLQNPSHRSL